MTLWKDLAEQARHLATREPKRPRQASLRRAISAAYYALFHRLTTEASAFLVSGGSAERRLLRTTLARAYDHAEMKKVSRAFSSGNPPQAWRPALGTGPLPPDLRVVAEAFIELQEARHQADYDVGRKYDRDEALELVRRCEEALTALTRCRKAVATEVYLVALLVHRHMRS